MLRAVGLGRVIPSQGWLGDFNTALPAVGIFGLWGGFGFCLILFIAGVSKIPASLYEAARVDGANAIREFFAVTLPGLRYELQVVLVLSVIGTLDTFDEIFVLTGGGPGTATTVPAYLIWRRGFQSDQVGSAAALGHHPHAHHLRGHLRDQSAHGAGSRRDEHHLAHAGHPQLRARDPLLRRRRLPAGGRRPREPVPVRARQLAVGVRAPAELRVAQLRDGLGARAGSRRASPTSIIVAAVMVPASVLLSVLGRLRVRHDAVPGLEGALLPVHPRADHPDRGDDRAAVLRRARDGPARHLLGADPARDLGRGGVRHLLDARRVPVGAAVAAGGGPDRRRVELADAVADHGAVRASRRSSR